MNMHTLQRASSIMVIPASWFDRLPSIVSTDPEQVMGWCDICGSLPPITCANGYMRRQCEHKPCTRRRIYEYP